MDYNENIPKDVIYGDITAGGMGYTHLFVLQAQQKMNQILLAYRHNTTLKTMFQTTFQWAQQLAGTTTGIFETPDIELPQLSQELWIITLRQYLQQAHLTLHLPNLQGIAVQRTLDQSLMDIALNDVNIARLNIQRINRCRIYLRVSTISDITNARGNEVNPGIFYCLSISRRNSNHLWPYQIRPGPKHRQAWRKFLQTLCLPNTLTLLTQLGPWVTSSYKPHWKAYFDIDLRNILIKDDTQWNHYTTYTHHRRSWKILRHDTIPDTTPPSALHNIIPLDIIHMTEEYITVSPPLHEAPTIPRVLPIITWTNYLSTLCSWERRILQDIQVPIQDYWYQITQCTSPLIVVSDGSYFERKGSYSWIISNGTQVLQKGMGMVPGNPFFFFLYNLSLKSCLRTPIRRNRPGLLSNL